MRSAAGLGNVDRYTATRHYFGWYAWNVLELDARDIALHFGHPGRWRASAQAVRARRRNARPRACACGVRASAAGTDAAARDGCLTHALRHDPPFAGLRAYRGQSPKMAWVGRFRLAQAIRRVRVDESPRRSRVTTAIRPVTNAQSTRAPHVGAPTRRREGDRRRRSPSLRTLSSTCSSRHRSGGAARRSGPRTRRCTGRFGPSRCTQAGSEERPGRPCLRCR